MTPSPFWNFNRFGTAIHPQTLHDEVQVKGQKAGSFFGEPPNGGGGERGIVQQSKENNKVLCENQKSRVA